MDRTHRWWTRIRVNPLFLLLLGGYWMLGQGAAALIGFLVVTLHELAHAVVADLFGLYVERVEIWPFGGMARIPGLVHQDPYVEAMVAVAGPLQNFLLAAVTWSAARWLPLRPELTNLFIQSNLLIGAINLLPAAPLDGGHLMRVFWARQFGYRPAERQIKEQGLWLARGLFVITLVLFVSGRPAVSLGLFAAFLYWGAMRSDHVASFWAVRDLERRALGFWKRPIWLVEDFAVRQDTPVGQVLQVMRPLKYHRVVVLDDQLRRQGILYEEDLLGVLINQGPEVTVGECLRDKK